MTRLKSNESIAAEAGTLLTALGVPHQSYVDGALEVQTRITGETIGRVEETGPAKAAHIIDEAHAAFLAWRNVPAPKRGELVRLLGEELRAAKADLGRLVTLEAGKIVSGA